MNAIALVFATSPADQSSAVAPFFAWFNLDDPWRQALVAFGLAGQVIFFTRWIIQWVASEKRGESHMPELFWWASLVGAMMLLTYFILDRDLVGILGQSVGWTVYSRNLYLIRRARRRAREKAPDADARDEP